MPSREKGISKNVNKHCYQRQFEVKPDKSVSTVVFGQYKWVFAYSLCYYNRFQNKGNSKINNKVCRQYYSQKIYHTLIYFYYLNFIRCILTAFNIANNATPTSANTASHIVANPPAPSINTMAFTPNAKAIFCQTIFFVCLPILIAIGILLGLSSCITTSAVSIVASLPKPPIAIPTSLNATTGASFTPSPTKATLSFLAFISLTLFTLSSGNKSPNALLIPNFSATNFTTVALSPLNIVVFTLSDFSFSIVIWASSFMVSAIVI